MVHFVLLILIFLKRLTGIGAKPNSHVQAASPVLFGGFLFFSDLPLPCGKITVVLLEGSLRIAVGCHECLHIRITVLFQNIGQFIQLFSDFLFCPQYLFCVRFAFLTLENPFVLASCCFNFGSTISYNVGFLQAKEKSRFLASLYQNIKL